MKTFKIESEHNVYIDSFTEGEGDAVNSYNTSREIKATNVKEAIEKYFQSVLYYDFDFSLAETYEGKLDYSVLVDKDNSEASKNQVELWKKDELVLYANNITITVYELTSVDLDKEL